MREPNVIAPPLLVLVILILLLFVRLINLDALTGDNPYMALVVLQIMIFALPGVFYCKLKGVGYVESTRLKLFGLNQVPIMLFLLFVMILGSIILKFVLHSIGISPTIVDDWTTAVPTHPGATIYIILAFAVMPALMEELIFRGILMTEYEKFGGTSAIIASALLFGMIHFDGPGFMIYMFVGLCLGFAAFATRSILAPMILHFIYNMYAIFVENHVWYMLGYRPSRVLFIFIASSAALVFLVLTIVEAERLFYNYAANREPEPILVKGTLRSGLTGVLLSPALLVCAVLFVIITLAG